MKIFILTGMLIMCCVCECSAEGKSAADSGAAENVLKNIKVTTSGSVDCSNPKTIAAAVFTGRTGEEKVLNFWHWYRRVMYHYGGRCRDFGDGFLGDNQPLCGSQRALQVMILKAGGYRTRGCSSKLSDGKGGFYAGHSFLEIFFDGRWHAMDAMTGFYIYSRTEPRYILSHAEMKADPALVSTAVEEKRVPEMFLACAREPEIRKDHHGPPWSYYGPFSKMIEYFAQGIPNGGVSSKEGSDYGGIYIPGRMHINLRPGESVTRTWDFEPVKFLGHRAKGGDTPTGFHRCGHNDEFDTVNFPFWEPYCKENVFRHKGQVIKRCYRYVAAGRFERRFNAAELKTVADSVKNIRIDSSGLAAQAGTTGEIEITTKFPYRIGGAEVTVEYSRTGPEDTLELYILHGRGSKKGEPFKVWSAEKTGRAGETTEFGNWLLRLAPREHMLRLVLGGTVRVHSVTISTIFSHNMYTGPYLVRGNNTVTVTVDNPKALEKHKLVVTYTYRDGKEWKDEHTVEKVITESPTVFDIRVKGPKHPRMRSVRVEVQKGDV